jgi:hypothetical protein
MIPLLSSVYVLTQHFSISFSYKTSKLDTWGNGSFDVLTKHLDVFYDLETEYTN